MTLNPLKGVYMNITRKKPTLTRNCLLDNHVSFNVTSYKYLGIMITNELKYNLNINVITQKAYDALCYLRRNLRHTSTQVKLTAYKTYVRLIL